ncbi:MAG: TRAP transporter substrate-binding protein [Pseudomonadota bacterium]
MPKALIRTLAAAFAAFGLSATANSAEVTLTVAHFLSPKATPHTKFIVPWAKRIEAQSKGRIKVEIFPAMTMGGKPPELYRQVRDGAADIVWTLTGYTPGVFPRSEVFELPTVHNASAKATTMAIQENFGLIADDFKDIKPLLVHVHAGNALHLVNGCAGSLSELKGLKLRTPSRTGAWMIQSWGAEPVGMPVPALPQALSKRAIDGALIPFEIVPPLKVHELTKCSMTAANNTRFGVAVFLYAMNKQRYEGLAPDLKATIDANSGTAIAESIGALWDSAELPGQSLQKKTGSPVEAFDKAATDEFSKRSEAVVERWIKEVSSKGIDGKALVAAARKSIAKFSK